MNSDIANALTTASVLPAANYAANANGTAVDLRAYEGNVQIITQGGVQDTGDDNSTFTVAVLESDDTNISNASATGVSVELTNVASITASGLDTRATKRYVFAQGTITGANSPAFPVSVSVTGLSKYSS